MSRPRTPVGLIARRDAREMLRSRYYRGSVLVQMLIVLALVVVASLISSDEPQEFTVATIEGAPGVERTAAAAQELAPERGLELELQPLGDQAALADAVEAGDVDAALDRRGLLTASDADEQLLALLQNAEGAQASAEALAEEGLPQERIEAALNPPRLDVRELDPDEKGAAGVAFLGGLLLYIALLSSGYSVAGGIAEEKGSRVIELLLSAVRPLQVLVGKLIGIGLVGLLQMVLIVGAGLALALALGGVDLPGTTGEVMLLVLLFFGLGYALYGCAFAAAGAIVSRQEDMQSTTSPLMLTLIAGYFISFAVNDNPEGSLATVTSLLPPTAPLVVPGRAAEGALPLWELLASVALMVVAIVLIARLGARIYERSVLRMGAPLTIREALRLAGR